MEGISATPVERDEVRVMFISIRDDVAEMKKAWERLEEIVGERGRKFFGAFYPVTKEYRVCVELNEDDDPDALGLEAGRLPGGRYLRAGCEASRLRFTTESVRSSRSWRVAQPRTRRVRASSSTAAGTRSTCFFPWPTSNVRPAG